jgi:hypothetical protein
MARAALKVVETGTESVVIFPPNMIELRLKIEGTAPLVMNAFPEKATRQLMSDMTTPANKRRTKKEREPRDFAAEFEAAQHRALDGGWVGIPCNGFRSCAIHGCRLVRGVHMTTAKQALFMKADGWDNRDGQGLVRLESPEPPEMKILPVRNKSGMKSVVDLRSRPMWRQWGAIITIHYDGDFIAAEHVINLFNRGGMQVGICEGRPGSPNSFGMGWGTFQITGALNPEKVELPDVTKLVEMLKEDAAHG